MWAATLGLNPGQSVHFSGISDKWVGFTDSSWDLLTEALVVWNISVASALVVHAKAETLVACGG